MQASIEQLKERLVSCLDEDRNVIDMSGALDVLSCLENSAVTKETLETTRLGAVVNDIRKKYAKTHPDLSTLCRNLIKKWQKLLSSSSTAAGGGGQSTGSAASSPAGALTTPRGTAARLASGMGLMCSPSPSLTAVVSSKGVGGGGKVLTPKLPNLVNGNVRSNSNSPKMDSSSIGRTNAAQVATTNCAQPSTSGKGPSPLALYTSSATLGGENNNGYSKPCSPAIAPINASSSSSSSLKIRIKVGGGSESASIVKNVEPQSISDEQTETKVKDFPADTSKIEKKLTNGLSNNNNNSASSMPIVDDSIFPSTSAVIIDTSVVVQSKKPRAKRQLDQNADDPLSMISKGAPLPKCRTTADLVAEMARVYPAEMAKSITNATLEIMPDLDEDVVVDRTLDSRDNLAYGKRYSSSSTIRRNSSDIGSFYYAKHDDYLDITKSEMVAQYLKTSIGEDDDDSSTYPSSSSPTAAAATPLHGDPPPRRRGRPRKNPDLQHQGSTSFTITFKTDKRPPDPTGAVDLIQTTAVAKQRRNVNWYDILPPLIDNDNGDDNIDRDDDEREKQFLDSYWPHETPLRDSSASADVAASSATLDSVGGTSFQDLHSRILSSIRDRRVLAMPYVDIGLPDFMEYRLPDSDRHVVHWSER